MDCCEGCNALEVRVKALEDLVGKLINNNNEYALKRVIRKVIVPVKGDFFTQQYYDVWKEIFLRTRTPGQWMLSKTNTFFNKEYGRLSMAKLITNFDAIPKASFQQNGQHGRLWFQKIMAVLFEYQERYWK